jgi:PHP family Zn ribbon phosphoesterase
MIFHTDFHIHTALSPCGDEDMTPNNIVNMAKLNGLDIIAITDHNTVENTKACMEVGAKASVLVIPGMELQTREDVHVVCLFRSYEKACLFQEYVYSMLPQARNNERVFGEQLVIDEYDEIKGRNERLLLTSANISLDEAFYEVNRLGGIFIPAHIDKDANGIIANLGFIPDYLDIKTLEYRSRDKLDLFLKSGLVGTNYNFIKSSDAHYLGDILDRENPLDLRACDINSVFERLTKSQ